MHLKHGGIPFEDRDYAAPHSNTSLIGLTYIAQKTLLHKPLKEKERGQHTKGVGSEQKIQQHRIMGAVSLGVVTGVRAESASDSGAVQHNEKQQSPLPGGIL